MTGATAPHKPFTSSFSLRAMLVAVAVVALVFGVLRVYSHNTHVSIVYELRAEFDSLPADDNALRIWLAEQPGIVRERSWVERDGKAVRVLFIMVRTVAGHPPIPDLEAKCKSLGYAGRDIQFRDYHKP